MQSVVAMLERRGWNISEAMLGTLLEFSICASPLPEALEAYASLGLSHVPASDIAPGAYAVMSGDGLAIGLYEPGADEASGREPAAITPVFVRPELKDHVRALRRRGVEFEFLELADDEFHRAGFRDPAGCMFHLIEARTFPPVEARTSTVAVCGRLVELSLAARALDEPLRFWTALGLEEAGAPPTPHASVRLHGCGLTIGLHETTRFASALTFRADNLGARVEYLRAKGFDVRNGSPLTSGHLSATLFAPGGVQFFIVDADAFDPPAAQQAR
ncbi:MAG: hypothetical protein JXB36_13445 [Gammaproteobacteria bacterium]|nr:hypothetical protein [Gammaproteobacteria bacterium]